MKRWVVVAAARAGVLPVRGCRPCGGAARAGVRCGLGQMIRQPSQVGKMRAALPERNRSRASSSSLSSCSRLSAWLAVIMG